jgi:small subunit ribosomal protein S7
MSRRNRATKREVLPDPMYNSTVVTKLVNQVMLDGKKGIAFGIVYGAFDIIKERTGEEPMEVFNKAIENLKPVLETKARRVGGATYQVPMEIRPDRRQTLAIRWLVSFARKRGGEKEMEKKLASEILDAYNNAGGAIKKKEEMHRMAEANKAFAHFKW